LDLNVKEGHEGYHLLMKCPQPVGMKSCLAEEKTLLATGQTAKPPTLSVQQQNAAAAKRKSRAMSVATKPFQQILMNAFMMYMSGNNLNIFSITIMMGAIMTPVSSLLTIEQTFKPFAGTGADDLQMPKLAYVALNLAWLALGLYKMSNMRLLPTTSADFTYKIQWKEMMEISSIPPDNTIL
jgi:hypothetical protein